MLRSGELPHALRSSLELFGAGLGLAIGIGFLLGLLLARVDVLRIGLEPYVAMLYATPMVALIPFILAVFGFEFRSKLIVVTLFGLWPILINTLEGARSVSPELLEVARSYRSNEPRLWWHVIVPYTLPYTMTGIRQGIARALVGMLASEFLLAASGLGNLILVYTQRFDTAHVLAAVLTITLVATALMAIGRAIENYFARWKAGV
jgi:NitT/TauT family transport system permease protein